MPSSSTRGSSSPFTATSTLASTATSLATTSGRGWSWGEIYTCSHHHFLLSLHSADIRSDLPLPPLSYIAGLMLVSCLLCVPTATRYLYRLRERTHSLWSYLWANRTDYINPLYRPGRSQTQGALKPSTAPYCFK